MDTSILDEFCEVLIGLQSYEDKYYENGLKKILADNNISLFTDNIEYIHNYISINGLHPTEYSFGQREIYFI